MSSNLFKDTKKRSRQGNPAPGASSRPPTSFVAPSQFYRLRSVSGINGGRFTSTSQPSFSDSVNSRLVGSRFQEVNRNSSAHGNLAYGSEVQVDDSGELGPTDSQRHLWVPDPNRFGPNYTIPEDERGEDAGWIDLSRDASRGPIESEENGAPSSFRRTPNAQVPSTQRETFPFRRDGEEGQGDDVPPHLRLQSSQPFVRPADGLNLHHLGAVYGDITHWRSQLKAVNHAIADSQRDGYSDIAEGVVANKGWILVGTNIRFLPGIEMIEVGLGFLSSIIYLSSNRVGLRRIFDTTFYSIHALLGLMALYSGSCVHLFPSFWQLVVSRPTLS